MKEIHVNLKRFDVPRKFGGLCPVPDSSAWIKRIMEQTLEYGLGNNDGFRLCYYLPESLIRPACDVINQSRESLSVNLSIGSQGVFRNDVIPGKNFGAFTTQLPPAAAVNLGAVWTIIGHSEERKDKEEILLAFSPEIEKRGETSARAAETINSLLNGEILAGLKAGMNILFCVGETEKERGTGNFSEQKPRIVKLLRSQLSGGLAGINEFSERELVIGYEPRWAIGPGKVPPDAQYISFVSSAIKDICSELFSRTFPVIYGGGLKEENAAMIAGIPTIDGGLVALTRFTGEIGFFVEDLKIITGKYCG